MFRRILGSGFALLLIIAALGLASAFAPNFGVNVGGLPISSVQDVKAADLALVCPGGAFQSGGASGTQLGVFDQAGTAELNSNANLSGATLTVAPLAGPSDSTSLPTSAIMPNRIARPTAVVVSDSTGKLEQGSTLLNASQIQLQSAANFSGLLAAGCQQPSAEQWFVGGDTTVGREALLVLVNPGRVDAQVNITAFGTGGQITADGLGGISVPASKTVVLQLASDLVNQSTLAIHVNSTAGTVAAWIQQRIVRGTIPGGSDFIAPSTQLAKNLTIPGLLLRGTADAAEIIKTRPAYADQSPMLRLFAPKVTDANGVAKRVTVTAQIFGATAKTYGTVIRQTITSGTATDIPITGLADGDYVAFISADEPIRAAIRLPRTNKTKSPATDFAWLQAADSLKGIRTFKVPQSGVTKLSLGNASASSITFQLGTQAQVEAGSAPVVKLAAGEARTIGLSAGVVVWIKSDSDALRANLVVDLDSAVASLPITNYKNLPGKTWISVR